MANWLEQLRQDSLNQTENSRAVQQEKEEESRKREAGYLMNKEAIDAKTSEILKFAQLVSNDNVYIQYKFSKETAHISNSGNNRSLLLKFDNEIVNVTFYANANFFYRFLDVRRKYATLELKLNELTTESISLWFEWLIKGGNQLPVTLKPYNVPKKTIFTLLILGSILAIAALFIFLLILFIIFLATTN